MMVTYSDLIQVGILIVGIIALFQRAKKEVTAGPLSLAITSSQCKG